MRREATVGTLLARVATGTFLDKDGLVDIDADMSLNEDP